MKVNFSYIFSHSDEYKGKRIVCLHMYDPHPIEPNTLGTIQFIDDAGVIHVLWDNGRTLGIVPDEDNYEIFD